jgi:hypothetical protein
MKRIIHRTLAWLAGSIALFSCNKTLLDQNPPDALTASTFWTNPTDTAYALSGLYNYLYASGGGYATWQFSPMAWDNFSDDSYGQYDYGGGRTATLAGITPATGFGGTFVADTYNNCYQAIAADNAFLANIGKIAGGSQLTRYKGEAFFLRGFNYFWLAQTYGNVPIVTADPFTIPLSTKMAKATQAQVIQQAAGDLDSAIAYLPDGPFATGHAVKASAEGYKIRLLLLKKDFAGAAALAAQVIAAGQFSLNPSYLSNFYKPDQRSSPEILFSVQYQLPTLYHSPSIALSLCWWKGEMGTQDLINEYEPGDPRKTMTFFFPGDGAAQGWPFTDQGGVATPGADSWIVGYYAVRKWLTPSLPNPTTYGVQDDNDFVLLRYADILLMYAEAQNEAVGPDATVYQQVNAVRARVKMSALPAGLTQDQMRQAIRHERRVEFAMEGLRYFDLRRWGIATQKLNGFHPNPVTPQVTYVYKDNYQFWPIPQPEIDRNQPKLVQNDGY